VRKRSLAVLAISLVVLSTIVVYSADAAGIPKKAISLASRFIESDLPTTSVFTDTVNTYTAGSKQTFQGSTSGTSGIALAGISGNPSSLTIGDLWFNTAANVNAFKFYDANSATQTIVSTTATCSNNQILKYQSASGTWACSSFLSAAVTSINTDSTAAQFFNQVTGNTTVTNQGTGQHTIDIGPNVVTTTGNNGRQTFQKGLDFGTAQTDYFGNIGIIVRNPANTFATTIAGGAVAANRTLNLPVTTGADTLGSLGMVQTWTGNNTMKFGAGGVIIRNPASTFTTTIEGGAVAANRTLNLPVTTGADTLATLGLAQTFTGGVKIQGFSKNEVGNKTSGYTATATDDVIYVDDTSGSVTITLPTAVGADGKVYVIEKVDASTNTVTVATTSSQTIDGATNVVLNNAMEKVTVQSNGHNWFSLSHKGDDINSYRIRSTTRYISSAVDAYTDVIGGTPASGTIVAYPFIVPKTIKIDQVGLPVSTSAPGTSCHAGIYTDNGNVVPSTLVSGSDVTLTTTSTGLKTGSVSLILQGNNLYWLAYTCSTATTLKVVTIPVTAVPNVLGSIPGATASSSGTGYSATFTYGALPATFPAAGQAVITTAPVEVVVRIAG
jgi:hypothetical protein